MASLLYRLGRRFYRARRIVALAWLAVLLVAGVGAATLNAGFDNAFSIPGTESSAALEQLDRTFPQVAGAGASYVVVAPDGGSVEDADVRDAVEDAVTAIGRIEHVEVVSDPYDDQLEGRISDDGTALILMAQMDSGADELTDATRDELTAAADDLRAALPDGAEVALGGQALMTNIPAISPTEGIGVVIALVVLLLTFGSFRAAGMPLLTAIVGVGVTMCGVVIATSLSTISATTPLLALMLGLAVGIDYALFVLSRHRDQLRQGMDAEESAARAMATAGSAVVFAGLTVMIALVGLFVANIPFLTTMGIAAAAGVAVAVLVSLTLTPALLGFAGDRLRPGFRAERRAARRAERAERATRRSGEVAATAASTTAAVTPRPDADDSVATRFFRGWVRAVTRVPALTIVGVLVAIALLSIPALSLRLALPDAGSNPKDSGTRQAYDLIGEHFGDGWNSPLIVTGTIVGSTDPLGLMADLKAELEALPDVAAVPLATPNATADTGILQVIPEGGPNSQATVDLVHEIRAMHDELEDEYGVDLSVTGQAAVAIDVSARLGAALLPFAILVVGLSLVLLTMVFRSIWVPVTAAIGFLLSVAASFGVVGAVFAWGWGAELLHVDRLGPILSFMPIVVMGVLFGLAMDYQVFLVSRMREEYVHTGDARRSIETGFVASARVVTAAAVIMFAVFAAFVPEGELNIKTIALGLAAGVAVDAFLVRMTLMPAVLRLLGDRAWALPRWLDRVLPSFDVEGEGLTRELELADWPEPGHRYAVAASGLTLAGAYDDVELRVLPGDVLAVTGPDRAARAALLLTLAGRTHADRGRLVVDRLAAPMRAGDIRSRVAVAFLGSAADPVAEVRAALAGRPAIVALDDLDAVADPAQLAAIERMLASARADRGAPPLTVVASTADPDTIAGLATPDRPVLAVAPASAPTLEKVN